jgi:hypothetical protein
MKICQAALGDKRCASEATREIIARVAKDQISDSVDDIHILLCDRHAGFGAELREEESKGAEQIAEQGEHACPRCGRHGVVLPLDGPPNGEILIHTVLGTFDLCIDKESLH